MKKFIFTFAVMIFMTANVFAEIKMPEGFVKGLPENLIAMDENGYSPDPENGEIYVYIPDMNPGELYTKDISLMNLREDAEYKIYMTATPNYTKGNVDMLNETRCRLYLDDKLIYEGLVNGDGTPNMQQNGLDLGGLYKSGISRKLHAEFVWNWSGKTTYDFEDKSSYYGEVSFYWTFYAQVFESRNPSNSGGNGGAGVTKPDKEPESENHTNNVAVNTNIETDIENVTGDNINNHLDNTEPSENNSDSEGNELLHEDNDKIENAEPNIIDGAIDKIVDKIPIIPEDVKTGYHSEIVFYTKIAIMALVTAFLIVLLITYKVIKLRNIKRNSVV